MLWEENDTPTPPFKQHDKVPDYIYLLNHLGKGFTISILYYMYIFITCLYKISFHSLKIYLLKHLRVLKSIKGDILQVLSNNHID